MNVDYKDLETHKVIVIGSGPSSVAACKALVDLGIRPTVIDVGLPTKLGSINNSKKIKTWFGSDAPYEQIEMSNLIYGDNLVVRQSFGYGGFSRVWGATTSPLEEFQMWEESLQPSKEDILLVESLIGVNLRMKATQEKPLHSIDAQRHLKLFSRDFDTHTSGGLSNLAIKLRGSNRCNFLKQCITGCPNDSIWFSGNDISQMVNENSITYLKDIFVKSLKIDQLDQSVFLTAINSKGDILNFKALKVFVAAGVIGSSAILLRSGLFDELVVKDTSTRFSAAISVLPHSNDGESVHTLSQWWVKNSLTPAFSLQIYSPAKEYEKRLHSELPSWIFKILPLSFINKFVHPVIVYFDSDISDSIKLKLVDGKIIIEAHNSFDNLMKQKEALKKVKKMLLKSRLYFPIFLSKPSEPGSGFHIGSSLPHLISTDYLGQLPDFPNVHFVDSSVLPKVPTGSITAFVMINAARISRIAGKKSLHKLK